MALKVDPIRVVQDPAYAAGLTNAHWKVLAEDPVWNEMVGEYPEMVEPVMALYAQRMTEVAPSQEVASSRMGGAASTGAVSTDDPAASFEVVGTRVPRLHGLGVVTDIG
ncbi:MAG: hypothetical protein ACRD1X_07015, partial [Vicinamibacteria bacterium]